MTDQAAPSTRIWYQSMTVLDEMGPYADSIARRARSILPPDTSVAVHGNPEAIYHGYVPGEVFRYPYLKAIIQKHSIAAAISAERQGFDAYVIGSFSEPFLKQTRSAVEIPVISLAESCLVTAWSLTERFALITLSPLYARRVGELVRSHGLESRFGGAYGLAKDYSERDAAQAFGKPDKMLERFAAAASLAVRDGADLLIPAEGMLNQIVAEAGISTIDGASVMDSIGVCLLHASMLVAMKRTTGLGHCRRFSYPVPPLQLRDAFSADPF